MLQSLLVYGGRGLLALLFILAGLAKILGPKPFLAHMAEFKVPAVFLPAVIALEIGAGLALMLGFQVRYAAGALGFFCILTALIFHHQLGVRPERTLFFKDLALAGALIALAAMAEAGGAAAAARALPGPTQ
jgi:putative oxidoreductase